MEDKSKVYIRIDDANRIIDLDGGYTISNIHNIDEWMLIDAGNGDKYNHCQNNYLDSQLMSDDGIYQYKWENGEIVHRTNSEMNADREKPEIEPTQQDRIEAQVMYTALMTDTLLEMEE